MDFRPGREYLLFD
jgi:hypothetical protein